MGDQTALAVVLNDEVADIVDRVRQGMVRLSNDHLGAGAGSVIHGEGLIITNSHVIRGREVRVDFRDGSSRAGKLLMRDHQLDLACVVVNRSGIEAIRLGNSSTVRAGELVFSLGYPWGMDGGLTYGVVIQCGAWPLENARSRMEMLSASLHLRPGHSGGPMFNARGEIIGLNTLMQGRDVGVALPINRAKQFLKDAFEAL